MYCTSEIANIVGGLFAGLESEVVKYLSVDSRKISFPSQTLFFAIATESRNGHLYLKDAYEQGVRNFVVSEPMPTEMIADSAFIAVPNTLKALQDLAVYHRSQFNIPVIGITGSNGKTIVKEWLNQILQDNYTIVRSPKSYNSQIGVPLSIWQLNESHTLGIFEAGISKPDEMDALQKMIQPSIGVLTNIGAAHDEGFLDKSQKLDEKLKLFRKSECVIYCGDDEPIRNALEQLDVAKFAWGKLPSCNVQVKAIIKQETFTNIIWKSAQSVGECILPFVDDASVENAMHCIAVCKYLELPDAEISEKIKQLHGIEMRLEWEKAVNNCYLLNDSYSNDLSSFIIALDYLQQQKQSNQQTVILSDFYESGLSDDELYGRVASLLKQREIDRLIIVGTHINKYQSLFLGTGLHLVTYNSTQALLEDFNGLVFANESILLKGARKFGFEKIAQLLEQKVHQTVLEINLTSLSHNLQQYRQLLQHGTKMMVMVKAFGYGSGDAEIARLLQFNKVDYLAVAYTDEGVSLRKAGIHLPIMVMNPEVSGFDTLDEYNLEPELYSFEIMEAFEQFCRTQGINQYPVHIKLDTGMHRLGFEEKDISILAKWLATQSALIVKSVFTHLVASEDVTQDGFTHQQAALFSNACSVLENHLSYPFIKHAVNTAGIRRHPIFHYDMVRLGIGLYGVDEGNINLHVVSTLKSTIAQTRFVKAGETVGYNRMGKVQRDSTIATVRIGYADGYRRQLGNGVGKMHVGGHYAPVCGNVCMDMTMVDITDVPGAKAGDVVQVFGSNIPIQLLAKQCHTISYEIMTSIGQRVKRIYVQE